MNLKLVLVVFVIVGCVSGHWRDQLLAALTDESSEDRRGGYLCFYIKAKLSFNRFNKDHKKREGELGAIRKQCGTKWVPSAPSQSSTKHVVLFTHNGFGNQLYQIAFAYVLAQSLNRHFHLGDSMPSFLYNPLNKHVLDPNTHEATLAGRKLLAFNRVDTKWLEETCIGSNVTFTDRKSDRKWWNSPFAKITDVAGWNQFFRRPGGEQSAIVETPKCLFMVGYWLNTQWFNPFLPEIRDTIRAALTRLPRLHLDKRAMVIHMRCGDPHYMTPPQEYYDAILSRSNWTDLWIAAAPRCARRKTYEYVLSKYGAKAYPDPPEHADLFQSEGLAFLKDFALLVSASRLILCPSTFSDWGGLLSTAKEIHTVYLTIPKGGTVSRNWSPLWSDDRYIYHDPYEGRYHGKYDYETRGVAFPPAGP